MFGKGFIDALLTQIRFENCLDNLLPKLYTDLNFKDGAHKSSPWRLFIFGVVNVMTAYLYHTGNKKSVWVLQDIWTGLNN